MKYIKINSIVILLFIFIITGCNVQLQEKNSTMESTESKENITDSSNEVINSVKAIINGKEYRINLENNETTKAFINLLPLEFTMNELNGNEKYIYLNSTLPTNSSNPKQINAGDVMLYGDNCLVIFYQSFTTSYSYTKIGHISDLPNLGNDSIKVRLE